MPQMIGNVDVEVAAKRAFWDGYVYDNVDSLRDHIVAAYGLSDEQTKNVNWAKVLFAHQTHPD